MVVPTGNSLPGGTPMRVTTAQWQLSCAVATPSWASGTTLLHAAASGPVKTVTLGGAVMVGGVTSGPPGVRSTLTKPVLMFGVIRSALPSQLRSTAAVSFGCQCDSRQVGP